MSLLRYVPPSVADIPIDWSRVPQASKEHMLRWAFDWKKNVKRPLPTTFADLAKWFDKSNKFIGYFDPKLCTLIMDISEFGLKPRRGHTQVRPRFYMKWCSQVWFILFAPGERDCVMGNSHDIITKEPGEDEAMDDEKDKEGAGDMQNEASNGSEEDSKKEDKAEENAEDKEDEEDMEEEEDEEDEPGAAEETALAQQFDIRLEEDISGGMVHLVKFTGKLGGWSASTLEDSLVSAQYAEAVLTLPRSHPAYRTLISDMFKSFQKSA